MEKQTLTRLLQSVSPYKHQPDVEHASERCPGPISNQQKRAGNDSIVAWLTPRAFAQMFFWAYR